MAIRCEEEFNPWPAFVDIFSAVILVLMLFLLVTLVNIGYYAQFKFKIQYTGSVSTDELILQETAKKIQIDEVKKTPNTSTQIATKNQTIIQEPIEQQMVKELQMATDIESVGLDLADVLKDPDAKQVQEIKEDDRYFYISFENREIQLDQITLEKLKGFIKLTKNKYPKSSLAISGIDPVGLLSYTVAKEKTLGRALGVRNLIRKFDYESNKVKVKLANKPTRLPDDLSIENGLIVIEVLGE